jgi:hypothetical protein
MEPFEEAVRNGDAAAVRVRLTKQPALRAAIDGPIFDAAPATVFSRHDPPMVDTLLDFGADIQRENRLVTGWFRGAGQHHSRFRQRRSTGRVAATCRRE